MGWEDTIEEEAPKASGWEASIQDEPAPPTEKSWGETALDALPAAGTVAGGLIGSAAGPVGTVAGGGGGYMLGADARDLAKDYLGYNAAPVTDGAERAKEVAGNFATGAASQAAGLGVGAGLSKVGQFIKGGASRFATSPLPQQIAEKTDIAGKVGSNVLGRVGAYTVPGPLKYVQGASDSMRGVQAAQKGVAWALDHAPESLGKFVNVLKNAAAQGGASAVATTDFLLSQKNPEYQQMKKGLHDQ
jgi:hypothetical protein